MSIVRRCAAALALLAVPSSAWGPAGHRTVAWIADQRLSPEVKARVAALLLNGQFTMAQVSTCPDALRFAEKNPMRPDDEYCAKIAAVIPNTGPWHYIDIPVPKPEKGIEAYCPNGNCVTAKVREFRDVLKNSNDDAKRREALMYLVHFVGDMHQPLHNAERKCDQGGNLEHTNVFLDSGARPDHRLHRVWDEDLVDKLMEEEKITDPQVLATTLAGRIKPTQAEKWKHTSIDQVAWEGWGIAKDHVYKNIPVYNYCDPAVKATPTPASDLSAGYEKEGAKLVHEQLMKGGVRLADLLENAMTH